MFASGLFGYVDAIKFECIFIRDDAFTTTLEFVQGISSSFPILTIGCDRVLSVGETQRKETDNGSNTGYESDRTAGA